MLVKLVVSEVAASVYVRVCSPVIFIHTFMRIGPRDAISFFRRISEDKNCAARLATAIVTACSLPATRFAPLVCSAPSGSLRTPALVCPPLAMEKSASPATVFTSGILKLFLRLIVRPLGLRERVRRRGDRTLVGLRRRVDVLRRRARKRLQAFLLMPPACLIAHLGSFATCRPSSHPHLSDTH